MRRRRNTDDPAYWVFTTFFCGAVSFVVAALYGVPIPWPYALFLGFLQPLIEYVEENL